MFLRRRAGRGVIDGERGNNRDWSINSVAGYAAYRTQDDLQVKARLSVSLCNDRDDNDTNSSTAIGIGFRNRARYSRC